MAALLSLSLAGCSKEPEPKPPVSDMGADMAADQGAQDMRGADMGEDMSAPLTETQAAIVGVPERQRRTLPGLSAPVHVVYTELGVPHVYAKTRQDMGRTLGFLLARDRFFNMDLQRRLAQGRISELLGEVTLGNDIDSRLTGMDEVTQRVLDGLTDDDRAYFQAYVDGVNAYVAGVKAGDEEPPSEYKLFRIFLSKPNAGALMEPFTVRDVAAMVAVIMYQTTFETGDVGRSAKYERLKAAYSEPTTALQAQRQAGAFADVWDRADPTFSAPSTVGWGIERGDADKREGAGAGAKKKRPAWTARVGASRPVSRGLLDRASSRLERLHDRLGRREYHNYGSNTWAVAGSHAQDGFALLAGDGHLPLSVPALMYQIGMDTKVFGGGDITQAGLLITSLPLLAVGTNGQIAWSQVNPFADITDWYREELQLDDQGRPQASRFDGQWRPLDVIEESYTIANVPALESVGRDETWARWRTFDGRLIYDIEGVEVDAMTTPEAGESVVNLGGRYVIPKDADGDGKITAVSMDYTALDTTRYVSTLEQFTRAESVEAYQELTRGLIGNLLYSAVADHKGDILFSAYQGVPCRSYLPRDPQTRAWLPGANPTMLLDGTVYGGFTIPSKADGKVDEAAGASDPYRCTVPFDETPQALSPAQGFVFNANNQPAPITDDGTLYDDPWYIGGPWYEVRGDSIRQGLERATAERGATIEDMATIQGDQRSRLGEHFVGDLLGAIAKARALGEADRVLTPDEQRLADLYTSRAGRLDEVVTRLAAWRDAGFVAHSGVATFYNPAPTQQEREDAVATMIFNAWLPRALQGVFDDEPLEYPDSSSIWKFRTLRRMLDDRAQGQLASHNEATGESAFFDVLGTPEVEGSDEVLLAALHRALDFLESTSETAGQGGFGTEDMSAWLWGLRHQVRFESIVAGFIDDPMLANLIAGFSITTRVLPLAPELADDDPRKGLKWFPRPGDNFSVDAANPGFSGTSFTHGSGPVMRMVIALKDGQVKGQNIIPGGQSGLNDSPHFADQAERWLGNQTIPLRFTPEEVVAGAVDREVFEP